jgi:hypothetical protein
MREQCRCLPVPVFLRPPDTTHTRHTHTAPLLSSSMIYQLCSHAVLAPPLLLLPAPSSHLVHMHTLGCTHTFALPHAHTASPPCPPEVSCMFCRFDGLQARVYTPILKNELSFSRAFFAKRDVDITIQTLRNTTKVSRCVRIAHRKHHVFFALPPIFERCCEPTHHKPPHHSH